MQQCLMQNSDLFRTQGIFKSQSNMSDDQPYSEPCIVRPVYSSIFKDIFRDIDAYSTTRTSAQLRGRGEASPVLFENRKRYPDFAKKGLDYFHFWVKFFIENIILKVSRRKNSKMFPCEAFFVAFLKKCLSKCPSSTNYSAIFRHIQKFVQRWYTQKSGILGILEQSEPFHNCIATHIQNSDIFKT